MLTRDNTKQLKAIAVALMLAHHLFTFPERIPYGLEFSDHIMISGKGLAQCIGVFGKICVSIFMFLGGYGLFKSAVTVDENNKEYKVKNTLFKRILKLYQAYWKVFLIFIPIGFLFFRHQIHYNDNNLGQVFSELDYRNLIATFIGYKSYYNSEWWFLRTYIFALFEGYIFIELFLKRRNIYFESIVVIIWQLLVSIFFPAILSVPLFEYASDNFWFNNLFAIDSYAPLFMVGILFGKYDIFASWDKAFQKLTSIEKVAIGIITGGICAYVRIFVCDISFDIILTPVFLFAMMMIINNLKYIGKILKFIGSHSTNMWLVHSFYCYYYK